MKRKTPFGRELLRIRIRLCRQLSKIRNCGIDKGGDKNELGRMG